MACQALGGQTGKNVKRRSHQSRGLAYRYYRITLFKKAKFRGLRVRFLGVMRQSGCRGFVAHEIINVRHWVPCGSQPDVYPFRRDCRTRSHPENRRSNGAVAAPGKYPPLVAARVR
jgi:hypothetical protein